MEQAANSHLQVNLSMNSQHMPLSGQRSIDGSGAPNSAVLPKVVTAQLNNSEVKPRPGAEMVPPDAQIMPMQSFDKRPPLMSNSHVGQSQDLRNKENMTHKQVARKGNQLIPANSVNSSENTSFSVSQKARILQLSNQGYEYS